MNDAVLDGSMFEIENQYWKLYKSLLETNLLNPTSVKKLISLKESQKYTDGSLDNSQELLFSHTLKSNSNLDYVKFWKISVVLPEPNNNQSSNKKKRTKTVVGCNKVIPGTHHHHHRNSKLYDRGRIK